MTCRDEDEAAAAVNSDGQQNQAPQRYQPQQIPSIRELHPATVRAIADIALRLFEALEEGSCPALGSTVEPRGWKTSGEASSSSTYGLNWWLGLFRERIVGELFSPARLDPQPPADQGGIGAFNVTAAESAASPRAEARERVTTKRAARLAQADPWRGEFDEPAYQEPGPEAPS